MEHTDKRREMRQIVLGGVVGILVVGMWFAWPHPHALLESAHLVGPINTERENWSWLSGDQLLIVTTDQEGGSQGQDWQGHADKMNIATRIRSRQVNLSKLLNQKGVSPIMAPCCFEMSPNGTWLVWVNRQSGDGWPSPGAAHIDGTHYREWDRSKFEESFFLDDRHWYEQGLSEPNKIVVRDLQDASQDREYPASAPEAKAALTHHTAPYPSFVEVSVLTQKNGDVQVIIDTYRAEDTIAFRLAQYDQKRSPPLPIKQNVLTLPHGYTYLRQGVSPQCQTLFFQLRTEQTNPFLAWLHRMIPALTIHPTVTESLWISQADGQGLREIGSVAAPNGETEDPALTAIEWLPDGKHISFAYREKLYVVPAATTN